MKAFWMYTLARLGVFLATWAVLWGISRLVFADSTVLDLWVLLVALIVSSVISILALRTLRDRVAIKLQERAQSLNDRIEESRRAEDVD
jgi:membrane protein implicated in regulation of membrane protease activity